MSTARGKAVCCFVIHEDVSRSFTISKWLYCALFTIVTVITWVLKTYSEEWFLNNSWAFTYCKDTQYEQTLCSGKQIAIRFSFANFSFFMLHAILLAFCRFEKDPRTGLHSSLWFWRCLLWAGGIVGFLFVPANAVVIYAQIARFGAGLFLVFIMVELVTWLYDVNEYLISKDNCWSWTALFTGAPLCFLGGLAAIGASYWFFAPSTACSLNIFICTWSVVMCLMMIGVLFIPNRLQVAGLLTSGAVFAYTSYLLFSALTSQPPNVCKSESVNPQWVTVSPLTPFVRTAVFHV